LNRDELHNNIYVVSRASSFDTLNISSRLGLQDAYKRLVMEIKSIKEIN